MTICVVTDRRRFDPPIGGLLAMLRRAVAAGVDLIQVRERDLDARDLASLVCDVLRFARGTPTRVVVNDRLDVALACGADGVHLRADSIAAGEARRISPAGFLVGRSIHTIADARAAGDVDYLIAGPVYPTSSKPNATQWLGPEGLAAIVRAASAPVLAIGGVTPGKICEIACTGAVGVAGISMFEHDTEAAIVRMRQAFDSMKPAP